MNEAEIKDYSAKAAKAMKWFGVNLGTRGYDYTKEALVLIESEGALTKYGAIQMYQIIAEKYGSTASKVERCIRHFISNAFIEGTAFYTKSIGITQKKPTNSHFLKVLSDYLKYNEV